MTKEMAYIRASSHFLTNELPKGWQDWDQEKLDNFIDDNRWEPFENKRAYSVEFIWETIRLLAKDFLKPEITPIPDHVTVEDAEEDFDWEKLELVYCMQTASCGFTKIEEYKVNISSVKKINHPLLKYKYRWSEQSFDLLLVNGNSVWLGHWQKDS